VRAPRPGKWHAPAFPGEILRFLVVVFFAEIGYWTAAIVGSPRSQAVLGPFDGPWLGVIVGAGFDGTMIFVSHDRAFLRRLSNRVLELGGESGTEAQPHLYPGSYVEYVERTGHEAPGVHA